MSGEKPIDGVRKRTASLIVFALTFFCDGQII